MEFDHTKGVIGIVRLPAYNPEFGHDDPPTITTETVPPDSVTHPSTADSSAAGGSSSATHQSWSPPVQPQVNQAPPQNDHVSILVDQPPPQDGNGPTSQVYIAPPKAGNGPPQIDQAPPQGGHGSSQVYIAPPQAGNAPLRIHCAPPKVDQGPPPPYSPGNPPPSKQPTGFMYENAQTFSMVTNPNVVAHPEFASPSAAPPGASPRPKREDTCETVIGGYVIPAFCAIFCCAWPCAIPSLIYAVYANFLKAEGRTQDAQEKSACARNWLIASVVTGIICIVIIVLLYSSGGAAQDNGY